MFRGMSQATNITGNFSLHCFCKNFFMETFTLIIYDKILIVRSPSPLTYPLNVNLKTIIPLKNQLDTGKNYLTRNEFIFFMYSVNRSLLVHMKEFFEINCSNMVTKFGFLYNYLNLWLKCRYGKIKTWQ